MRGARISTKSKKHVFDLSRWTSLTEVEGHQKDVGKNSEVTERANIE